MAEPNEIEKLILPLVRENIRALTPYSSARDEFSGSANVWLDANENPFNTPYNRYPDPRQTALREKIAALKAVPAEWIFSGNGSDEAIDLLFRVFCDPGKDNVVTIDPTYGMYSVCADIHNIEVRKARLNSDFSLDPDAIGREVDGQTRLLFVCSPNNPTSNAFDPSDIVALAKEHHLIVVLDEAYIDFSRQESLKAMVGELPNLVVLQTFSKAWGLAGIRLGIAIAHPVIRRLLDKVKYPYNLNTLTQQFAMKALDDVQQKEEWVGDILAERNKLAKRLKVFRFVEKVYPSDANFLLVRMRNPLDVYKFLLEHQIIVRDRSRIELCEGSLRITVGSGEENGLLIKALMEYQRMYVDSCEL